MTEPPPEILAIASEVDCPSWCVLTAGHPYEDWQLGDGLAREHQAAPIEAGGLTLTLARTEIAAGAAGPIVLTPFDLLLRTVGSHPRDLDISAVTAADARSLASAFLSLSARLEDE